MSPRPNFAVAVCFYFAVMCFHASFETAQKQTHFRKLGVNDVTFTEDILFNWTAKSKIDCGSKCSEHPGCMTFTFHMGSFPMSCQGHSSEMSFSSAKTTSLGSTSFVLLHGDRTEMDCPTPPEIPHAAPLNASKESGTAVRYACTPPESMVLVGGPPDVTCGLHGSWTTPNFTCFECSNTTNITLTGNSGVLTSPGYPGNHADFLDCFYVISLDQPGPQAVTATVESNVEDVEDCIWDYFIINDDGEKYCGTGNFTKVFLVAENQWSVHFYADYVDNYARAFRIEYDVTCIAANEADGICEIPRCVPPPPIDQATPLTTLRSAGSTVSYACKPEGVGVLIDGPPDVICQSNGFWTTPTFSCVECSNTTNITLTGNSGVLTSPGYPGNHADFLDCFYVISLDQPGPQAVTTTVEYNVEDVMDCIFDYFIINDDGEKYCGTGNFTKVFLVAENQWSVHFYADYADNYARAFRIEYNVTCIPAEDASGRCDCGSPPAVVNATPVNTLDVFEGGTVTYSCDPEGVVIDGPADVTCQSNRTWTTPTFSCIDCKANDIDIRGNNGTLTSPGYPGHYATSMDCVYIVTLDQPGPQTVTVSVQYNLEFAATCEYDHIVLNGDGEKICGSGSQTKSFVVDGSQWELLLHSDSEVTQERGFVLHYHVV